jgi:hypothetical protein
MAFTVGTVPWTTFRTPGGRPVTAVYIKLADDGVGYRPARSHSSAMIIAAPGSRSEGLRMTVFPVAIAIGIDQSGIMLRCAFW